MLQPSVIPLAWLFIVDVAFWVIVILKQGSNELMEGDLNISIIMLWIYEWDIIWNQEW